MAPAKQKPARKKAQARLDTETIENGLEKDTISQALETPPPFDAGQTAVGTTPDNSSNSQLAPPGGDTINPSNEPPEISKDAQSRRYPTRFSMRTDQRGAALQEGREQVMAAKAVKTKTRKDAEAAERARKSAEQAAKLAAIDALKDRIAQLESERANEDQLLDSEFTVTVPPAGALEAMPLLYAGARSHAATHDGHNTSSDDSDEDRLSKRDHGPGHRGLGARAEHAVAMDIDTHGDPEHPQDGNTTDQGKRKPTKAQKRQMKRDTVRSDLASRRAIRNLPDTVSTSPTQHQDTADIIDVSDTPRTPAPKKAQQAIPAATDAFSTSWRRRLQQQKASSPSLASVASKSASPAPRSYASAKAAATRPYRHDQVEDRLGSNTMGGFDDVDVHVDRAKALGSHPKGRAIKKGPSSVDFYEVSDVEEIFSGTRKRKGAAASSRKVTRPHKQPKVSDDDDDNDNHYDNHSGGNGNTRGRHKYDTLPEWVKPDIKEKVIPSIREYIGTQKDPWSLDTPKFTFLQLVQKLFDNVFPARHYTFATGDPIYEWCQQQCYDWRKTIQKIANETVGAEIAAHQADTELSAFERSTQGQAAWLKRAMQRGGEAMWGRPDTSKPEEARDQLQSKYVLKTVAYHLKCIKGSVLEEAGLLDVADITYPRGAVALAAAAVQRAFEWYRDGQPKGLPQPRFSSRVAGGTTGFWMERAVGDLLHRTHRFDRLLEHALQYVETPKVSKACRSQETAASMYIRERSSSPPAF